MTAKAILNPYAGRWLAQQRREEAERALQEAGISYDLEATQGPGHGTELASQAVQAGYSPIISIGGDGSISEVVNGMLIGAGDGTPPPLGILPLGTANDLVKNVGLPVDLAESANIIALGKSRLMDIGQLTWGPEGQTRYFDNNSAMGLEPTVTLIQQRLTRLRGVVRYLASTLMAIAQNPSWEVRLEWDGGSYAGPVTLVTVGNCALTGGLFYMTPHADPFDGKLTFVYAYMKTRPQILQLLPRTMKPGAGSYVEHPNVHEVHTTWLKIQSLSPSPVHTDGEIQSVSTQEMAYRILPGKLPVLLGEERSPTSA